ncbi:MAG: nucleotide exchange factor GrpE [Chitinophagaceae bacterium]|nr:MAG: nucleotide exchange factor GrpE [Chitinophagaceae bacterium]
MEENKQSLPEDMEMDINADADIPGSNHLSNPQDEQDGSIEKLQEEVQEQKDKFLRLFAEFDNYKRRTSKEKMEMIQTAGKDIILSMLEVLDDCERAEKQMEQSEDIAQLKEGNRLVFAKLKNILAQKGLKPVDSIQKDFDVEQHEAITEIEAGEENRGKVVDEVQKGYTLNGKQIRFAKVVVGR